VIVTTTLPGLKTQIGKALARAQQEMMLTLPGQLALAFRQKVYERDIDPQTGKPFTSFYRWLWLAPPAGCGLCGSPYLDVEDIIRVMEKVRDGRHPDDRANLNALIEDLVLGHGASKGKGGRPKKETTENLMSTHQVNGRGGSRSRSPSSLAARMAESNDPKVQAAWHDYLAGKYRSVTAAAIACGMIEDANAPLARLRQYWRKASPAERRTFLKEVREESA
jgi:hypothetical protein